MLDCHLLSVLNPKYFPKLSSLFIATASALPAFPSSPLEIFTSLPSPQLSWSKTTTRGRRRRPPSAAVERGRVGTSPCPALQREPVPQLVTTAPGRAQGTPAQHPALAAVAFQPSLLRPAVWFQTQTYYQHLGARGAKPETSCAAKTAKATV